MSRKGSSAASPAPSVRPAPARFPRTAPSPRAWRTALGLATVAALAGGLATGARASGDPDAACPVAVESGSAPARPAARWLAACDGACPELEVAACLDLLRRSAAAGPDPEAARALLSLLPENSPLYDGRGPREIARLRGYLLLTLADLGPPPEAAVFVAGELFHGHDPYLVAAAARLGGRLPGAGEMLAPHFLRYLDPTFHDVEVGLSGYNPGWPLEQPTTVRLEVVEALGRLGCGARAAEPALRELADAAPVHPFHRKAELREAAQLALAEVAAAADCPPEGPRAAAALDGARAWLPAERRRPNGVGAVTAVDQNGAVLRFGELTGRPVALTFFYTRCENPYKCSLTVTRLGQLQELLERSGLEGRVVLAAVSLEPAYDTSERLRRFAEGRGVEMDGATAILRTSPEDLDRLVRELGVGVSFGRGQVGLHGVQLFLLDAAGRLAVQYDRLAWPEESVLADLRALLSE